MPSFFALMLSVPGPNTVSAPIVHIPLSLDMKLFSPISIIFKSGIILFTATLPVIVAFPKEMVFVAGSNDAMPSTPGITLRSPQFLPVKATPATFTPYVTGPITTLPFTNAPSRATPRSAASNFAPTGSVTPQPSSTRASILIIAPFSPSTRTTASRTVSELFCASMPQIHHLLLTATSQSSIVNAVPPIDTQYPSRHDRSSLPVPLIVVGLSITSALPSEVILLLPSSHIVNPSHALLMMPDPNSLLFRIEASSRIRTLVLGLNDTFPVTPSITLRSLQLLDVTFTSFTIMPYFSSGAITTLVFTKKPSTAMPCNTGSNAAFSGALT